MGNDFRGKNCLVYGTGISGKGAAALLLESGANVFLYDENEDMDFSGVEEFLPDKKGLQLIAGDLSEEIKDSMDIVVMSPGVPLDRPLAVWFGEKGTQMIGEIELAFRLGKGTILAITGTNGKTTTTTLLGCIMENYAKEVPGKRDVLVVGNIGEPYTFHASATKDSTIVVAEISSFQLETSVTFKPHVSAILNITPDHLNRHHTMENYAAMKRRITENQDENDFIILNYDDPLCREAALGQRAKVVYFTRNENYGSEGAENDFVHLERNVIYYNDRRLIGTDEIRLLGTHNYENVMAAAAMAVSFGVPDDIIRETIRNFNAVEHRIEFVRTVDGADYYNDSKGTNPDASIKAVEAMVKPTVLIAGGYDKKSSYDEFIGSFHGRVKLLVLLGQTAEEIRRCAETHGFNDIIMASDLKEAVNICHDHAGEGDAVLLSPACASWGMFKNYEERGRLFKEYVNSL